MRHHNIIYLILLFLSCCTDKKKEALSRDINNFYSKHRNEAVKTFSNHSVFIREEHLLIYIYDKKDTLRYVFHDFNNEDISQIRIIDSLSSKELPDYLNYNDSTNQKDIRTSYAIYLLKKLKQFKVHEVSADNLELGIDLVFYFDFDNRFYYASNIKNIKNGEWLKLIRGSQMFDSSWYYYKVVYGSGSN